MCGIIGLYGKNNIVYDLLMGLNALQHRGQDAAGIITFEKTFHIKKGLGLVSQVFEQRHADRLTGEIGVGHVRYTTQGTNELTNAQPIAANYPFGIAMAHNGTPDQINNPPQSFQKSTHTLSGHGDPIYRDSTLGQMDVECELTAVISKTARHLTLENAMDHVLGFTIGNDVTLPEQTPHDHLLLQTKNGDGFTPLGPWIETDFVNYDDVTMFVRVNGKQVIQSSTNQLARGVAAQLVYVTKYTTLGRGDVLLGGSPTSMYAVHAGDQVEIEIEGIGVLANPVVAS